jgi:hypothetical protein
MYKRYLGLLNPVQFDQIDLMITLTFITLHGFRYIKNKLGDVQLRPVLFFN